jgi:hypothetical protein
MSDVIQHISIDKPIFVAGLARSGSTILLETLAAYRGVATQRYRDFPFLFTPIWWNRFLDRAPRRSASLQPRVHADGILVSSESPEALEEPLWRTFFPENHVRGTSHVLDAGTSHPRFESFYRNHLRKVLSIRGGDRYLCKGNYHVARLEYLLQLFPDARFIVPIRTPRSHVASLMKQHRLFTSGETRHPRSLAQMRACGHFEFGLDRRVIDFGIPEIVSSIEQMWRYGEEARGWACYWSQVYGYLADRFDECRALRDATELVWYDELCSRPIETLRRLEFHCELPGDERQRTWLAARLHEPTYYRPNFSPAEEAAIESETWRVMRRLTADASSRRRIA